MMTFNEVIMSNQLRDIVVHADFISGECVDVDIKKYRLFKCDQPGQVLLVGDTPIPAIKIFTDNMELLNNQELLGKVISIEARYKDTYYSFYIHNGLDFTKINIEDVA